MGPRWHGTPSTGHNEAARPTIHAQSLAVLVRSVVAEIPPITIRLNEDGIAQVAAMISHLHVMNEHLDARVTELQALSTEQVERIRLLQAEVATLRQLNALLERR